MPRTVITNASLTLAGISPKDAKKGLRVFGKKIRELLRSELGGGKRLLLSCPDGPRKSDLLFSALSAYFLANGYSARRLTLDGCQQHFWLGHDTSVLSTTTFLWLDLVGRPAPGRSDVMVQGVFDLLRGRYTLQRPTAVSFDVPIFSPVLDSVETIYGKSLADLVQSWSAGRSV